MKRKSKRVSLGIVLLFILLIALSSVIVVATGPIVVEVSSPFGNVEYDSPIESNNSLTNLESAISIGFHTISVNDITYPELDAPATITFNSFYGSNPIILKNGVLQPGLTPTPVGFGQWEIDVEGFSAYQIVESDFTNGTFDNTTIADLGGGSSGVTLDTDALLIINFESNGTTDDSLMEGVITNLDRYHIDVDTSDNQNAYDQGCVVGDCMAFDGTDSQVIHVGTSVYFNELVNGSEPFTIMGWQYKETGSASFALWDNMASVSGARLIASGSHMLFNRRDSLSVICQRAISQTENTWEHFTAVYNLTHYILYKNAVPGTPLAETCGQGNTIGASAYIGYAPNNNLWGTGKVDEVKIWQRALEQPEIQQIYGNESAGISAKMILNVSDIAYFVEFNRSQLDDVEELINNYNGTISGNSRTSYRSSDGIDVTGTNYFNGEIGGYTRIGQEDDDMLIPPESNFTISAWFNSEDVSLSQGITGYTSVGSFNYFAYSIYLQGSTVRTAVGNGTNAVQQSWTYTLNNDEWHHILYEINQTHMIAYIDNTLIGSVDITSTLTGTVPGQTSIGTRSDGIGARYNGIADPFIGKIDNVYYFDRLLTENERNTLYWSNQKVALFAEEEIIPAIAINFNNDSAYDYIQETIYPNDGILEQFSPDDTIAFTNFDGSNIDGIDVTDLDMPINTFTAWIFMNSSQIQGTTTTFVRGGAGQIWQGLRNSTHNLVYSNRNITGSQIQCSTGVSSIEYNTWTHVAFILENENAQIYIDGELTQDCPGIYTGGTSTDAEYTYLGTYGTGSLDFTGAMDNIYIYNTNLNATQVQELYNETAPIYLHKQTGLYTSQIFNTTVISPEIQVNLWENIEAINYDSVEDVNSTEIVNGKIYVKSSNDPTLVESAIPTEFQYNGSHYVASTPPGPSQGIYAQYLLHLGQGGNPYGIYSDNILQITMNNYMYTTPWVTNVTIPLTTPFTTDDTTGYATFGLNDTDDGFINFTWFVNGINVFSTLSTGGLLTNGTEASSTLASTFYVKDDIINMTAFACLTDQPTVCSTPTWSNDATVQNSNYFYTSTPNNNVTIQLTKPAARLFTITFLSDLDNDATVSWLVDGSEVSTLDTYTLGSTIYDDYQLLTLVANITDSEFNNTVTWNIEILPAPVQAVGAIAITMFIIFIIGIFFFVPFLARKFTTNPITDMILKRGSWVIAIFLAMNGAAIMATIASNTGLPLTEEMFFYMWLLGRAGYLLMAFMVLKTLFDVIELYKTNQNSKRMGG